MPDFLIEDSLTGLKTVVEADSEPTQEDALSAISVVEQTLKKSLYKAQGNRYMLDVGPLTKLRESSDTVDELHYDIGRSIQNNAAWQRAFDRAGPSATEAYKAAKVLGMDWIPYELIYDAEMEKALKEERAKIPQIEKKTTTQKIFDNLPQNTLLLISHGAEKGGLYTDDSMEFTLNNVSKILGNDCSNVNNLYNLSCYSGQQLPVHFGSAFPMATNVVQGQTNLPNTLSINNIQLGKYFEGTTPSRWIKNGTNWEQRPYTPMLKEEFNYEVFHYQPETK